MRALAHPGANTTGFSYLEVSIGGKWIKSSQGDCSANLTCRLHGESAEGSVQRGDLPFAQEAAQRLGVQYVAAPIFEPTRIKPAVATLAHEPNGGLIISPDATTITHRNRLSLAARKYGYLRSSPSRYSPIDGGLISLRGSLHRTFPTGSILRGSKTARRKAPDLPVQPEQVLSGYQPQDRQGARPRSASNTAHSG